MTPSRVAVSIRDVSRSFSGVVALHAVTLDVRDGEFFSLLGPSGCGKTTLLRIIAGFVPPSTGEIFIGDRNVTQEPPYRRRTNMVFQDGALFPHLTVARNVAFGLEMRRAPAAEIERRVSDSLELVRLTGYEHRSITQLSGGQRQRVALARALVNEPDVLLLDEPLSALDLQLRLHMRDELRRLQRLTGSTFIFVTHDQGEAIAISDRIAVMHGGQILQVGTPREIYERPRQKFVAEFVGRSNFLPGVAVRSDGNGVVTVRCHDLEITGLGPESIQAGDEVMVALRYEKVQLAAAANASESRVGEVVDETYLGSTVRRIVDLPGGIKLISEMSNTAPQPELELGRRVRVGWAADAPCVVRG
jgi:spermidine/putrescine ABC transporter ATP-binding subunit